MSAARTSTADRWVSTADANVLRAAWGKVTCRNTDTHAVQIIVVWQTKQNRGISCLQSHPYREVGAEVEHRNLPTLEPSTDQAGSNLCTLHLGAPACVRTQSCVHSRDLLTPRQKCDMPYHLVGGDRCVHSTMQQHNLLFHLSWSKQSFKKRPTRSVELNVHQRTSQLHHEDTPGVSNTCSLHKQRLMGETHFSRRKRSAHHQHTVPSQDRSKQH